MKRGFEENVPKVRPRVRLGRALEELDGAGAVDSEPPEERVQVAQAREATASAPPARVSEAPAVEGDEAGRRDRLSQVRMRAQAAAEPLPERGSAEPRATDPAEGSAGAATARRAKKGALQVAQLAKELSAELELAAEANGRLKQDLDGALASLRKAAEEARERAEERDRLSLEVEKRSAAARDLLAELELLEAERDGALAQVARFARELRESRARVDEQARAAEKLRTESDEVRGQLRRLAAELEARVAERDAARTELQRLRVEKDELAQALVSARAEADEAVESRSALEEIERALGEARSRVAGIR